MRLSTHLRVLELKEVALIKKEKEDQGLDLQPSRAWERGLGSSAPVFNHHASFSFKSTALTRWDLTVC